jgi:hypothetical protein
LDLVRIAARAFRRVFVALRYYWITAKGYRLQPWDSPYIHWRMETFYGADAANLDRRKYFQLMWRERARIRHFLDWVDERRRAQHTRGV